MGNFFHLLDILSQCRIFTVYFINTFYIEVTIFISFLKKICQKSLFTMKIEGTPAIHCALRDV